MKNLMLKGRIYEKYDVGIEYSEIHTIVYDI
jgi:hypothetical protein